MKKYCIPLLLICFSFCCSPQKQNTGRETDAKNIINTIVKDSTINAGRYSNISQWYLQNRVQVHSRLLVRDIDNPAFWNLPKQMAAEGATVFTRQVKAADEQPWWPTAYGTMNPATTKLNSNGHNFARDAITQIHNLGMKSILYYRHSEDEEMLNLHPDWGCRSIKDSLIDNERGYAMCFNSPYRNIVIGRLVELASYGADGFNFDNVHTPYYPVMACFCPYCQAKYKQEYGIDEKQDYKAGNKLRFFEFRNNTIENFFTDLQDSLNNHGYNPLLLVSGNSWPALSELHMNSEIYSKFTLKSELGLPARSINRGTFKMPANVKSEIPGFYLNAFYYSFMRDNSAGPPRIWCPFVDNEEDALCISSGVICMGCIPTVDVDANTKDITIFSKPLAWNKKYATDFASLIPYAYEGVIVSENERNQFINNPDQAWQQVITPAYKTFKQLYDAGIPAALLDDAAITESRTNELKNVYCNLSLTQKIISNNNVLDKCSSFDDLPKGDEKQIAISVKSPMFCIKNNPYTHFNYFKNNEGYIYAMYAPDFTQNITVPKEHLKANDDYIRTEAYTKAKTFLFYVKKENIPAGKLEDVVNNKTITPLREEDGYYVFSFSVNESEKLGMVRFKTNL